MTPLDVVKCNMQVSRDQQLVLNPRSCSACAHDLHGCACHGLSKLLSTADEPEQVPHHPEGTYLILRLVSCRVAPCFYVRRLMLRSSISVLMSSVQGFSLTVQEQGLKGLVRGWAPTLVGYSVQGAGKFGEYLFLVM